MAPPHSRGARSEPDRPTDAAPGGESDFYQEAGSLRFLRGSVHHSGVFHGDSGAIYTAGDADLAVSDAAFTLHAARTLYDDGVMTRNSPGIAGLAPAARVFLGPRDASLLAVEDGDRVVVRGEGTVELPVAIDASLAEGTVFVPFNLEATTPVGAVPAVSIDVVRQDR